MGKNAEIVKGVHAAFAKGDVATVLGALDPKIGWREADGFLHAEGNPYIGPESVATGIVQRVVTDVENFSVSPVNAIDGGDGVVVEGRYKGKWNKTGTPVDAQFVHVWGLRDGKVVRFQQYTDTRQWAKAAGV